MSKMPAKKKSCFQITSVTTAQVATSITEDTESLDDPDESRTEDVSSEIFDVSRATDFGPEEEEEEKVEVVEEEVEGCERSSSEETLNNVGDAETPGTVSPNLLLDGQLAAAMATTATATVTAPANEGAASGRPAASTSQPAASCSSRFRVIKLDHGSGEPYRRGRWTCMEYYERDSDPLARSGDCIRHGGTFEPAADRDSGLGATAGSVVASATAASSSLPGPHGSDSGPDSSLPPPAEKTSQPGPAPSPGGGAVAPGSMPMPPLFPGAPPGSGPPVGPNGAGLPLACVAPTQPGPMPFAYSQMPPPPGQALPVQATGPSEFLQPSSPAQPAGSGVAPAAAAAASLPLSNASVGCTAVQPGDPAAPAGVAPAAVAGAGPLGLMPSGAGPPPSVPPPPSVGSSGMPSVGPTGPHAVVPGVANVPGVSTSASSVTTMPNVPAAQPPVSRSSGSALQHAGLSLAQGATSAPTSLPQPDLSQFHTQTTPPLAGPVDDTRRKSEPLPQPPLALIADNKPAVKPVADALANPLQLTPINSLTTSVFSIAIPVDGDEDRNPSTAFYQAFHLNTFQESKNLWDSASGGGGVAIDNKIEQAMDLVKSHLMYAVREEVEVLKEQIKDLVERNSLLERENALLKSLSNNDQLSQLPAQPANPGSTSQQQAVTAQPPQPAQPPQQPNVSSA
ncbi:TSC22 domain family protein 2 [Suncus etruscus]|uniref:TSC22 domain family protein 2 n=1 Tax=Suncus etruscus TaxID=109475 RepID=UPI00210FBA0E|nr:TSC22 domain family protein 2 [Suncus etruscus]